MYAAELHQLRTLIRSSTLVAPKKKRGTVGVGSLVALQNGTQYRIAGDWTQHAGRHHDGTYWVSRHTPVAQALLGKRLGDNVSFGTNQTTIEGIV